jgi:hypothetical protein
MSDFDDREPKPYRLYVVGKARTWNSVIVANVTMLPSQAIDSRACHKPSSTCQRR